jgi:hypothetical protein
MAKAKQQPEGRGSRRAAVVSSPYGSSKPKPKPPPSKKSPANKVDSGLPKHKGRPPKPGTPAWHAQKKLNAEYKAAQKAGVVQPSPAKDDEDSDLTEDDEEDEEPEEEVKEEPMEVKEDKGKAKEENENCPVCNCGQKEGAEGVWVECDK